MYKKLIQKEKRELNQALVSSLRLCDLGLDDDSTTASTSVSTTPNKPFNEMGCVFEDFIDTNGNDLLAESVFGVSGGYKSKAQINEKPEDADKGINSGLANFSNMNTSSTKNEDTWPTQTGFMLQHTDDELADLSKFELAPGFDLLKILDGTTQLVKPHPLTKGKMMEKKGCVEAKERTWLFFLKKMALAQQDSKRNSLLKQITSRANRLEIGLQTRDDTIKLDRTRKHACLEIPVLHML
ncbi:hypothetical protein AX774_g7381, partial [Zancudomyces culisetae]